MNLKRIAAATLGSAAAAALWLGGTSVAHADEYYYYSGYTSYTHAGCAHYAIHPYQSYQCRRAGFYPTTYYELWVAR